MPYGGVRVYGGGAGGFGTLNAETGRYQVTHRGRTYKVHRLVCEAFHGPAPEGKPYVLHRDEDCANNKPRNLKWGTQKENLNAPGFIAYCKGRTGDDSPRIKGRRARAE